MTLPDRHGDGTPDVGFTNPQICERAAAFRAAVEGFDIKLAASMLSPAVVYYSPATYEPLRGIDLIERSVSAAFEVFDTFTYVRELTDSDGPGYLFEATFDGIPISGFEMFRWGEDGRVTEIVVTLRPVETAQQFVTRVMAKLLAAG